jgi:hypothetical protein
MDKSNGSYSCKHCNKQYASYKSLWNHNTKFHNNSTSNSTLNVVTSTSNSTSNENKHQCKFCLKNYSSRQNKWNHEQKCKINNIPNKNLEIEKIQLEKLKEENKLMKLKIKLQGMKSKAVNKYLMDRSYNNNVNSNNTINNNYQILSIGNEQLNEVLTMKDKKAIINSKLCALEKIVEIAHCGNYNKFKNIIITNLKDNFAYKYDENKGYFVTTTKNDVFNDLVSYRITDIEEIYIIINKIDNDTKELIQKFLDRIQNENQPFIDHLDYKSYKINNIKILLYNNQDKITKDIALLFSDDTNIR